MNPELVQYIQQQIRTNNDRIRRFTENPKGKKHPKRYLFIKIENYIKSFINKNSTTRMVIIPGFRGVGKTTLMAQLCETQTTNQNISQILFTSIEEALNTFDCSIIELISAFEEVIGTNLEESKKPILIFLDEIQTDPKWASTLKTLYEKTTNVFFCCSGSAALALQNTPDLARRVVFEKLPPMCFTEFQMTKNNIYPEKGIKNRLKEALYFSKDHKTAFNELKKNHPAINQYWTKVDRKEIQKYLSYGSFPFAFDMPNETAVYNAITQLLEKVIKQDLPKFGNFEIDTLNATKRVLFTIAGNDTTSFQKLNDIFDITRPTLGKLFDALESAELLIKIPPYGSNMSIAKKPSKYLFMSPAIRMAFFHITGNESTYHTHLGKLLEDSIGAHLYRELKCNGNAEIRYDSSEGGADFITQVENNKQIIIEVGTGEKGLKQINNSLKKITSNYNIIISKSELNLHEESKTIFLPLDYYFLM